ncbi:MAG: hypothetical protein U1E76_08655 [Planctomycetota bacterium]
MLPAWSRPHFGSCRAPRRRTCQARPAPTRPRRPPTRGPPPLCPSSKRRPTPAATASRTKNRILVERALANAKAAVEQNDLARAENELIEGLKIDPQNDAIQKELARVQELQGKRPGEVSALREAAEQRYDEIAGSS